MNHYVYQTEKTQDAEYQPATQAGVQSNNDLQNTRAIAMLSAGNSNENQMFATNQMYDCNGMRQTVRQETVMPLDYIPAFLQNHIGRWARIDFLIGNCVEQRVGQILEVGSNYIVLRGLEPESIVMCDLPSIKFATIIMDEDLSRLFSL